MDLYINIKVFIMRHFTRILLWFMVEKIGIYSVVIFTTDSPNQSHNGGYENNQIEIKC